MKTLISSLFIFFGTDPSSSDGRFILISFATIHLQFYESAFPATQYIRVPTMHSVFSDTQKIESGYITNRNDLSTNLKQISSEI